MDKGLVYVMSHENKKTIPKNIFDKINYFC